MKLQAPAFPELWQEMFHSSHSLALKCQNERHVDYSTVDGSVSGSNNFVTTKSKAEASPKDNYSIISFCAKPESSGYLGFGVREHMMFSILAVQLTVLHCIVSIIKVHLYTCVCVCICLCGWVSVHVRTCVCVCICLCG